MNRSVEGLVRGVDAVYSIDRERIRRRSALIRSTPALRLANASAMASLRDGFAQALLRTRVARSQLEGEVLGGAIASAPETGARYWEASGARQPLGRYIRRALLHLGRLGDAAPRQRRR